MLKRAVTTAIVFLATSAAMAEGLPEEQLQNWHQWRGPLGTGVAPLGKPPLEWSETKNVKWKVAIPGSGSASPVVWGDRIYVLTAIKTGKTAGSTAANADNAVRQVSYSGAEGPLLAQNRDQRPNDRGPGRGGRGRGQGRGGFGIEAPTNVHQFVVLCLDRRTGETIWQKTAAEEVPHEGHHQTNSFASASPITDGKHVWASFGSRGIYCYDVDGNLKWKKDFGDMETRNNFGEGSSPTLHDGTLIVIWDHEGTDFIVALDALTGDEKWRQPRDEPTTWATPLVVEANGKTQVITSGTKRVRSYDFANGDLLWECGGLGTNPIATPVVIDGIAIAMSGHQEPAGIAVPLDARGDVTDSDQVAWSVTEITPYVASPVLYEDLLYITKNRNALLSILEAKTGNVVVNQKRLPEQDTLYASPVAAAGRVYFPSREGMTVVIKHGREFEVLAQNPLDETIDASPAIVGDEIFIRGDKHLYCIAEQ